jgi:dipeptidyl aminopeptidase/acylaminoacyl peptidase
LSGAQPNARLGCGRVYRRRAAADRQQSEYRTNGVRRLAHQGTADLRQYLIGLLGDPVKDKAVYEAASPLTYLQNTKAPVLVLQGENDPRVPRGEAAQVVEKLQATGHVVDVHYYPAEGHGFAKRENEIDALERTVAWFDRYLKPPVGKSLQE